MDVIKVIAYDPVFWGSCVAGLVAASIVWRLLSYATEVLKLVLAWALYIGIGLVIAYSCFTQYEQYKQLLQPAYTMADKWMSPWLTPWMNGFMVSYNAWKESQVPLSTPPVPLVPEPRTEVTRRKHRHG